MGRMIRAHNHNNASRGGPSITSNRAATNSAKPATTKVVDRPFASTLDSPSPDISNTSPDLSDKIPSPAFSEAFESEAGEDMAFATPECILVEGDNCCSSNRATHKLAKLRTADDLINQVSNETILTAAEVRRRQRLKNMKWTQGHHFQAGVGAIIILNALSLGLEAEYGDSHVFVIAENVFTALFTLELLVRVNVEGLHAYSHDRMNALDAMLVMLSVLDVWILDPLGETIELRVMSALRILRLLRLARLLRLFRIFKELTVIIKSMAASARSLFWAGIFLLICVYMFAIFATQKFGKATECDDDAAKPNLLRMLKPKDGNLAADECDMFHFPTGIGNQESLFGSVERSMLTLYVCLTDGCGFDVVQPMSLKRPWVVVYFYIFTFVTTFGILNVIVGLFCENIIMAANESERALAREQEDRRLQTLSQLKDLFTCLDQDGSETITREEFHKALEENEDVLTCLEELGLQDEAHLFDTLDINQSGSVNVLEFFEGMMFILRGPEAARAKDIMTTHLNSQWIRSHLHTVHHETQKSFKRLETVLKEDIAHDIKNAAERVHVSLSTHYGDFAPVPAERRGKDSPNTSSKFPKAPNCKFPPVLTENGNLNGFDEAPTRSPETTSVKLDESHGQLSQQTCLTSCSSKSDDDKFLALHAAVAGLASKVESADTRTQSRLDQLESLVKSVSEQVGEVQNRLQCVNTSGSIAGL